jgi:hypothetical protein
LNYHSKFLTSWIEWEEEWIAYFNSPLDIRTIVKKKYVEAGGPTDAELKKIEKEANDVYTMPLKDLFKLDDIEVQDTACDGYVNE